MTPRLYYVVHAGAQAPVGPFDIDTIVSMIHRGEVKDDAKVAIAGSPKWDPINYVPEFGVTFGQVKAAQEQLAEQQRQTATEQAVVASAEKKTRETARTKLVLAWIFLVPAAFAWPFTASGNQTATNHPLGYLFISLGFGWLGMILWAKYSGKAPWKMVQAARFLTTSVTRSVYAAYLPPVALVLGSISGFGLNDRCHDDLEAANKAVTAEQRLAHAIKAEHSCAQFIDKKVEAMLVRDKATGTIRAAKILAERKVAERKEAARVAETASLKTQASEGKRENILNLYGQAMNLKADPADWEKLLISAGKSKFQVVANYARTKVNCKNPDDTNWENLAAHVADVRTLKDISGAKQALAALERCRVKLRASRVAQYVEIGQVVRKFYAQRWENESLDKGLSVTITVSGRNKDHITFKFALVSKVWKHELNKGTRLGEMAKLGFKKFTLTDGWRDNWYWDLEPPPLDLELPKGMRQPFVL